ncbi:hypothetical protein CLV98_11710 [Dyadobacter jejuensis]|uniref:Uncharacterized protein n=1 Tax=Dyadobacter jejuensis TaxID=1082580 RepID=A0A316AAA6_9BACT|nr:hypothetical protein CLV98_11710 [Dyadobacter jejuensis]
MGLLFIDSLILQRISGLSKSYLQDLQSFLLDLNIRIKISRSLPGDIDGIGEAVGSVIAQIVFDGPVTRIAYHPLT